VNPQHQAANARIALKSLCTPLDALFLHDLIERHATQGRLEFGFQVVGKRTPFRWHRNRCPSRPTLIHLPIRLFAIVAGSVATGWLGPALSARTTTPAAATTPATSAAAILAAGTFTAPLPCPGWSLGRFRRSLATLGRLLRERLADDRGQATGRRRSY
jgi:hypothetical protein